MSNPAQSPDLVPDLIRAAKAAAQLATSDEQFRAGIDAFRAVDGDSFQRLLTQLRLGEECELLCRWIRVKESVLRCIEFCGPPREPITIEAIPGFAEAITRLSRRPESIELLADVILERDADGYRRLVKQLEIEPFCHLFCYWATTIYTRLICEVVCKPGPLGRTHLIAELTAASAAVAGVVRQRGALDQIVKAAVAVDCEVLSGLLEPGGSCLLLCEWICSWRCVLTCMVLCRPFPPRADTSIAEIREFAQAIGRVATTQGAFARLVTAIAAGNAEPYGALIKELNLEAFCVQLCHWICFEICRRFCICVCPPAEVIPLFTKVGQYRVDPIWGDFTVDGTTTAGSLAFTSTIPLIGIIGDGDTPTPVEYRFLTEKYPLGGGPAPLTAAMIPPTIIGQLEYYEYDQTLLIWIVRSANFWANNPDPSTNTITITQPGPTPLTVGVNQAVAADGWIAVPRLNALSAGGVGRFIGGSNNVLANLDTTRLTLENFDLTPAAPPLPVAAGDAVPAAQQSAKPQFQITFQARNATTHAAIGTNALDRIALSNTTYTYILHPDWAGGPTTRTSVASLDIVELKAGGGCNPVKGHIHALFTAYHPYLGTCEVYIQGPGVPPPAAVNPAISAAGQALSPAGGQDFNISSLKPCAYVLWLTTTLNLTVGYGKLGGEYDDLIAFCIH